MEKPARRRYPAPVLEVFWTSVRISSHRAKRSSQRDSSVSAAGVSRTRRPSGSSSATPRSRARVRIWWETAEAV